MNNNLVIFGSGGFAREVVSFIRDNNEFNIVGFIDIYKNDVIDGYKILGTDGDMYNIIKSYNINSAFIAVGNRTTRRKIYESLETYQIKVINIIHPNAYVAPDCIIGKGVIVYPHVTINTNSKIGNSVLINSNVSIGHDVVINDFTNINPGVDIAGRVVIGEGVMLGIGSSILENINIGDNAIIGGGALVNKNVMIDSTVVGVPAKVK